MSETDHGERLRACRQRLGMTQTEASRRVGMKVQQFHSYEKGKLATLDLLHRIAVAIGADPAEIDPRLASTGQGGRTLSLVFAGRDAEHVTLAGDTPEDDRLVRELLPVPGVTRSNLDRLFEAAINARVKLVIRTDQAPRVVAPEPDPEPTRPKKGGRRRPA